MKITPDQLAQLVTRSDLGGLEERFRSDLNGLEERLPSKKSFNMLTGAIEDLATAVKDLRIEIASHEFRIKRLEGMKM